MYICVCNYVCIYVCMCVFMYLCIYVCMYVCMYGFMYKEKPHKWLSTDVFHSWSSWYAFDPETTSDVGTELRFPDLIVCVSKSHHIPSSPVAKQSQATGAGPKGLYKLNRTIYLGMPLIPRQPVM